MCGGIEAGQGIRPEHHGHAARPQGRDYHLRRGCGHHVGIGLHQRNGPAAQGAQVGVIVDFGRNLNYGFVLGCFVDDDVVGRGPVGQNNGIALRRDKNGVENLNFPYFARLTLRFDGVAHHVGLENEDEHPAREIGQRTL